MHSSISSLTLPIIDVLADIQQRLNSSDTLIIEAPPGAGKTTVVPLSLLHAPCLAHQKIYMLQPRRVAARACAERMANLLGESVGQTIGYQIRQDNRVSQKTRIVVMTEGVLTRHLQQDPELENVGLVIFDEFHERNLHSDFGLALCLQSRNLFRDPQQPLKLIVMSATLHGLPIHDYLKSAPIIRSEGRQFPVDVAYRPSNAQLWAADSLGRVIEEALHKHNGDVLIFLPGQREIQKAISQYSTQFNDINCYPLYGGLTINQQQQVLQPNNKRKLIFATDIAETSLTIEGISTVIDTGLTRVPHYDPKTGISRLQTRRISKASSTQRAGRAGRLGPGVCYRLWSESEQRQLVDHLPPEIEQSDLASLALQLLRWGVGDPNEIEWLTPPPQGNYCQAIDLLAAFGAIKKHPSGHWVITGYGEQLADFPAHPRFAHLIMQARFSAEFESACCVAALMSERDPLSSQLGSDIASRIDIFLHGKHYPKQHSQWYSRINKQKNSFIQFAKTITQKETSDKVRELSELLALAFPDRIAKRISPEGRFKMSNGRTAHLRPDDPLSSAQWIVALDVGGRKNHADDQIFIASHVNISIFNSRLSHFVNKKEEIQWHEDGSKLAAQQKYFIGRLLWKTKPINNLSPELIEMSLINFIRQRGLRILPWDDTCRQWQARAILISEYDIDQAWPNVSDEHLSETLEHWLGGHLGSVRTASELAKLDLKKILRGSLDWHQQQRLDELAPTHFTVPSGSTIKIDYTQTPPILAVKLQEMFGQPTTPTIMNGRVKLVMHLLSPARRPLQVTQDLAAFWQNAYQDVKREMRGRYPKHPWPDDPTTSIATRAIKNT